MKYSILILFVFLSSCFADQELDSKLDKLKTKETLKEEFIFKDYDFSDGTYTLFFINSDYNNADQKYQYIRNNYIISSREFLQFIKSDFTGMEVDWIHRCGYDYNIYLTRNDSVLLDMRINFHCEHLSTSNYSNYTIDTLKVKKYLENGEQLFLSEFKFADNRSEALKIAKDINDDSLVVLKELFKPIWCSFEGYFTVIYETKDSKSQEEIGRLIKDSIQKKYPQSDFSLKHSGSQSGGGEHALYYFDISCNENLFEGFNLFEIFKPWTKYDNYIYRVFRKEKPYR